MRLVLRAALLIFTSEKFSRSFVSASMKALRGPAGFASSALNFLLSKTQSQIVTSCGTDTGQLVIPSSGQEHTMCIRVWWFEDDHYLSGFSRLPVCWLQLWGCGKLSYWLIGSCWRSTTTELSLIQNATMSRSCASLHWVDFVADSNANVWPINNKLPTFEPSPVWNLPTEKPRLQRTLAFSNILVE